MNTIIEKAIADWLKSLTAFVGITIHPGQSDEEIPHDEPIIYIVCTNTESPAPSLYSASVQVIASTPEVTVGNIDVHKSIIASMREALRETENMAAFFPATVHCAGAAINKWDDSQDNGRWTTAADLTLGVVDGMAII